MCLTEALLEQSQVEMILFIFFLLLILRPFFFFFFLQGLLVDFLFSVTLAKYLGVNKTAQKNIKTVHNYTQKKIVGEKMQWFFIANKSNGLNLYTHWSPGNTDGHWTDSRFTYTSLIGKFSPLTPAGEAFTNERVDIIHTSMRNWIYLASHKRNRMTDGINIFSHIDWSNQFPVIVHDSCCSVANGTTIASQKCKQTHSRQHSTRHSFHTDSDWPSSQGLSSKDVLKLHSRKEKKYY